MNDNKESNPNSGKPSAAELTLMAERSFYAELTRLVPAFERVEAEIRERLAVRGAQIEALVTNDLDAMNAGWALRAVAAFDVLAPRLGREKSISIIDHCLNEPLRSPVLAGTRQMLDAAPDPFSELVGASKEREASYFGPSFLFEHLVDDDHGYVLEIRRCLYHQVLLACGALDLMPVICRADLNWIDAIEPHRHHLRFVSPSTFASADRCRMWFMRTDGDDHTRLRVARGT